MGKQLRRSREITFQVVTKRLSVSAPARCTCGNYGKAGSLGEQQIYGKAANLPFIGGY